MAYRSRSASPLVALAAVRRTCSTGRRAHALAPCRWMRPRRRCRRGRSAVAPHRPTLPHMRYLQRRRCTRPPHPDAAAPAKPVRRRVHSPHHRAASSPAVSLLGPLHRAGSRGRRDSDPRAFGAACTLPPGSAHGHVRCREGSSAPTPRHSPGPSPAVRVHLRSHHPGTALGFATRGRPSGRPREGGQRQAE